MLGLREALALAVAAAALCACQAGAHDARAVALGADPERGRLLIAQEGCGACHDIPGVAGADGLVGPSLQNIARRTVIAGVLPNTPENMVRWIETPQSVVPGNAMPNMEINDHDARDVAAYLYTLR